VSPAVRSHAPFNFRRITDPVHGTVGISELEYQIINRSRAFKRLRNIKQLGLAHYVFPAADYSRFSHSVGVCHLVGRMLGSLRRSGHTISDQEIQTYRLAGLFHDLGHYPFSHTMEDAVRDASAKDRNILPKNGAKKSAAHRKPSQFSEPPFGHEQLGLKILEIDQELKNIFDRYGIYRDAHGDELYRVILDDVREVLSKENPLNMKFMSLISSDLDADRIDYLLRNAYHTGIPYGSVDINYLLSEMRLDDKNLICWTEKALRTADHFFLGRYFDYQQVPFNKTVKAAELMLQDVIGALIDLKKIDVSRDALIGKISDQSWGDFDDGYIIERIRELARSPTSSVVLKAKAESILYRQTPKLVAEMEYIAPSTGSGGTSKQHFERIVKNVRQNIEKWATEFGINKELWRVWPKSVQLTKIGSVRLLGDEADDGEKELARILIGGESRPVVNLPYSILGVMSNYHFHALRVYVLFPNGDEKRREEIGKKIRDDEPDDSWKKFDFSSRSIDTTFIKDDSATKRSRSRNRNSSS
jgi:HD superfamily phosphohydrolase